MVTRAEVLKVVGIDKAMLFDIYMTQFQPYIIGNEVHYPDQAVSFFLRLHTHSHPSKAERNKKE
jgi:hypothetical protein